MISEDSELNLKQMLGLIGSVITLIGVFCPFVSTPLTGTVSAFENGRSMGAIILVLAVIALLFSVMRRYLGMGLMGLAILGVILDLFIREQLYISHLKERMSGHSDSGFLRELAHVASHSIELDWGWAMLLIGGLLILAGALLRENR
ncbi:MAG: hypothetical protein KGQ58_02210 [Proteobacteria bacterium]|nr:hypothetical protein [Pseudomonadota bacterium]